MPRREDEIQTLEELQNTPGTISKACTIGLVIDITSSYFDDIKKRYVKKMKVVDHTYNSTLYNPKMKKPYVTIYFYGPTSETSMPRPHNIGDIIYLRRFSFTNFDGSLVGHYTEAKYCSWALLNGPKSNTTEEYESNRPLQLTTNPQKYGSFPESLREIRQWGQKFLKENSIQKVLPVGTTPQDKDYIVCVTDRTLTGIYVKTSNNENLIIPIPTINPCATKGEVCRLRSVARIERNKHENIVVVNSFTSLVPLFSWSYDAEKFLNGKGVPMEEEKMYTSLFELNKMPLNACSNKKYVCKVEVANVAPSSYKEAVGYYDDKKNTISTNATKGSYPVYKICLSCLDSVQKSTTKRQSNLFDLWVFSFDGLGNDFLPNFNLEDQNDLSTGVEQEFFYEKRCDDLMNQKNVKLTVEVMNDGKGGRMLRAVNFDANE